MLYCLSIFQSVEICFSYQPQNDFVLLNCEGKLRNFERVNCMMFGKSQFCQLDSQKIFPEIAYIDAVLVKVKK